MGQSLGVPVWKLLGGKFRDRVPAYANGWYQAEREAGAIARLARGVVERGYRALKLDPFGAASAELPAADRRRAESIVAAVREAVGPDVQILIEMHGRFTPATAVRVAAMLEPYDPEWIEEPVPPENAAALARVQGGDADPDRDRRARALDRRHPRVRRNRRRRRRAGRSHALRRLPADEAPRRVGRRALPAAGAAQRLRTGRHDGERPFRGRDAELQGARALQRLRRSVGAGSRRPSRRGSPPTMAASACPIVRASASG